MTGEFAGNICFSSDKKKPGTRFHAPGFCGLLPRRGYILGLAAAADRTKSSEANTEQCHARGFGSPGRRGRRRESSSSEVIGNGNTRRREGGQRRDNVVAATRKAKACKGRHVSLEGGAGAGDSVLPQQGGDGGVDHRGKRQTLAEGDGLVCCQRKEGRGIFGS